MLEIVKVVLVLAVGGYFGFCIGRKDYGMLIFGLAGIALSMIVLAGLQ